MNEDKHLSRIEEILRKQREEDKEMHLANLTWFVENQRYLVFLYENKHLIIRHQQVVGMFDDGYEARHWASVKFPDRQYSYQHCIPGPQAYSIDTIR